MTNVPIEVQKRAIFEQEFRTVVESKHILAPVVTTLISKAKNIYSPFTSVDPAKAYTTPCVVPISPLTINKDELILDRYIGNAITDCEEELEWAAFDATAHIRGDVYASVLKKLNQENVADIAADATQALSLDISSRAKVRRFLIGVAADVASGSIGLRTKVDGARVERAAKHGRPFVAAGREAFVQIVDAVQGILSQSTAQYGLAGGDILETPYGVTVINLADAAEDPAQVIWGTAGAPTVAYRDDKIEVDQGRYVGESTYTGSTDLELENGDAVLKKTWYIYAKTLGTAGVLTDVKPLVLEAIAQVDPTPAS